ncbi:MAG: endonuclease V [Candidatus Abyssobacteria bacterium SURF_5]|uniref:Endonuclease V n=1 Tax=Abyssobacteria bacterium (strain SURF_5) TaxID=2093360 RepID=A0A3A4NIH7_ABYX5|nr:MAG: endonuclease V [Candidatus Abyssubacteria bacterium SURF_5]
MLRVKQLHKWKVTYREAAAIQNSLRERIDFSPLRRSPKTVAGADVAYDKKTDVLFAAIVVIRLPSLEVIEETVVEGKTSFPYIPGLLSFREAPIVAKAFKQLTVSPDALICDGQGIAHPRGFGLASHLGVLLDIPSVGCAKSRLIGTYREPGPNRGNFTLLKREKSVSTDEITNSVYQPPETIGAVVRTRAGVKPVFVSVGHRIDLRGAIRLVLRCCNGCRIPEPTRRAHILVNTAKRTARPF